MTISAAICPIQDVYKRQVYDRTSLTDENEAIERIGDAEIVIDVYKRQGWGKVNGTQVKNHYPKGLRNKI